MKAVTKVALRDAGLETCSVLHLGEVMAAMKARQRVQTKAATWDEEKDSRLG